MECPSCSKSFLDGKSIPRILTKCGHTICHKCLKALIEAVDYYHVKCPFCSIDYTIEEARASPNNYYILNMTQDLLQSDSSMLQQNERPCPIHPYQKTDFYCRSERAYLCSTCLLSGIHTGHDIVHAGDQVEIYRKQANLHVRQLTERCDRLQNSQEKFMRHLGEYQALTKKTVSSMEEKFTKIVHQLTKKKEELLHNFNTTTMHMNKYLKDKITLLNKKQEVLNDYITEAKINNNKLYGRTADLNEIEDYTWDDRIIDDISKDLSKAFRVERRTRNFEDVMGEIEAIEFTFAQTPFFVYNEELHKNYLENFLHVSSFDFGLDPHFKLENEIFIPADSRRGRHYSKRSPTKLNMSIQKKVKLEPVIQLQKPQEEVQFQQSRMPTLFKNPLKHYLDHGNKDDVKEEEIESQLNLHHIPPLVTQAPVKMEAEVAPELEADETLEKSINLSLTHQESNTMEIFKCSTLEDPGKETTIVLTKRMVKYEPIIPPNPYKIKLEAISPLTSPRVGPSKMAIGASNLARMVKLETISPLTSPRVSTPKINLSGSNLAKMVKLEAIGPSPVTRPSIVAPKFVKQEELFTPNVFSRENSQQKLSTSTAISNYSPQLPWEITHEIGDQSPNYISSTFKDPFWDPESSETVVCLLGQNNKALYITDSGEIELVSLELEFRSEEERKGYVLKNFASCVLLDKNKVLYAGGGPSNDAYLLEFKTKRKAIVTSLPKMSQKRCWHGMVYCKPYVYIMGGFDGKSRIKECEKLNLEESDTPAFEAMPSMNEARSQFGFTICDNKSIFVVGGQSNSLKAGSTDTIERYDIDKDKWILMEVRLPLKLCGVSCAYFEDEQKIKIFGGSDSIKKSTRLVFELDIASNAGKLREGNVMVKRRQMNNKIYKKEEKLYLIGGTIENDCEVWRKFATNEELIMEKTLISYEKVIQGDLNNFCGFII